MLGIVAAAAFGDTQSANPPRFRRMGVAATMAGLARHRPCDNRSRYGGGMAVLDLVQPVRLELACGAADSVGSGAPRCCTIRQR